MRLRTIQHSCSGKRQSRLQNSQTLIKQISPHTSSAKHQEVSVREQTVFPTIAKHILHKVNPHLHIRSFAIAPSFSIKRVIQQTSVSLLYVYIVGSL